jgi:hypothetical protein
MPSAALRLAAGFVALLAMLGLVLEYQNYTSLFSGLALVWRTIDFFSFFTIEANIFVALVAGAAALGGEPRWTAWLTRPAVAGAVGLYAAVAGAIYFVLLRYQHHPVGLALLADDLLHYIVPPAFLMLWLAAIPKGRLSRRVIAAWMVFPVVYFGYALARGPRTGFSPYPFIDPARFGYGGVALNIAALGLAFAGVGVVLVAVDRALGTRREKARAEVAVN